MTETLTLKGRRRVVRLAAAEQIARKSVLDDTPPPAGKVNMKPNRSKHGAAPGHRVLTFVLSGSDETEVGKRAGTILANCARLGLTFEGATDAQPPLCCMCDGDASVGLPAVIIDRERSAFALRAICDECGDKIGAHGETTMHAWLELREPRK